MERFNVSSQKENLLLKKMDELNILEEDIAETFVKSSGKGGQNVNKSNTCVNLKHIPSGITVKFDRERSQILNRFFARRELVNRIEAVRLGKESDDQKRIYKLKKQKKRRKRRNVNKLKKP